MGSGDSLTARRARRLANRIGLGAWAFSEGRPLRMSPAMAITPRLTAPDGPLRGSSIRHIKHVRRCGRSPGPAGAIIRVRRAYGVVSPIAITSDPEKCRKIVERTQASPVCEPHASVFPQGSPSPSRSVGRSGLASNARSARARRCRRALNTQRTTNAAVRAITSVRSDSRR
jgi:hypothetical protein